MDDSEYESLPTEKVTVHLAAGALAGVMEHCVMYPVDCVKVRSICFTTVVYTNFSIDFHMVNSFLLVG